jgi:hypothetical protein
MILNIKYPISDNFFFDNELVRSVSTKMLKIVLLNLFKVLKTNVGSREKNEQKFTILNKTGNKSKIRDKTLNP